MRAVHGSVQKARLRDSTLVAIHSRVRQVPGETETAVVHTLRFDDGRIVELWDEGEPVESPKDLMH